MKKFLLTRIGIILAIGLVCILGFGIFAYAGTFSKDVPGTITIKATNPDIGLYSDASCTIPITSIDFGEISSGTPLTKFVYIKNIGNKDLTAVTANNNLDPALGTITASTVPTLAKGATASIRLDVETVEILEDAAPAVTISFSGSY